MAAATATFRVEGLASLDRALRELPDEVAGPIMEAALEDAGEVVRRAAADNIHSRSGRTAADLRVVVQVEPEKTRGVAAVGAGDKKEKTSRGHVLRWLEFGTKPHKIVAGKADRKTAGKVVRVLKKIGNVSAAARVKRDVKYKQALASSSKIFGRVVRHPGMANQSPLTRALADNGEEAVATLSRSLWRGIRDFAARHHVGGGL